jgi:hypothetical protein
MVIFLTCMFLAMLCWSDSFEWKASGTVGVIPVFVSTRKIPQFKTEEPVEEEWPHHQISPQLKALLLRQSGQPILIPQHSLQEDSSGASQAAKDLGRAILEYASAWKRKGNPSAADYIKG